MYVYAIRYQYCLTPIGLAEVVLRRPREYDNLVGTLRSRPLAELDVCARKPATLCPLPVEAVYSRDRSDARPVRKPQRHTRTLCVIVDDIGTLPDSTKSSEERRTESSQPLRVDRADGNHADAVFDALRRGCVSGHHVTPAAVVAGDLVAERSHASCQLGDHNLDSALAGAEPLVPDHCNAHGTSSHVP